MAQRVFVHIGAPKSGTTFVQEAMWQSRDRLREQGVLYPGRVRMDHFYATLAVRELSFDGRPPHARTAWTRLLDESNSWDGTTIISHEFFGAATTEQARRAVEALAPAEVHLIYTARDYVRQLPAYWQESLKMRYMGGLGEYVRAALADELTGPWSWLTMDSVAVLGRWGKHVPPERVHVVTVPQPGASHDLLWRRFAAVIGVGPDSCDLSVASPNESLGVVESELLRRVKPKVPAQVTTDLATTYRWQRAYLAQELLVPRSRERFGLRPDEVAALRDLSQSAADQLAEAGYTIVGDLADIVPPTEAPSLRHPEDVSDRELLDAATETIGLMLGDVQRQTLRAERAERAAAKASNAARAARTPRPAGRVSGARSMRERLKTLSERHPGLRALRAWYTRVRTVTANCRWTIRL